MSKNIQNNEIIQNIALNRGLYTKTILRYKKADDLGVLDYSFNISNATIDPDEDETANSLLYSLKTFKHRNYKELKLTTFLPYQELSPTKLAFNFNKTTKQLADENTKNYLQIIEPVKGGFFGYYAGLYGFIPQSHFRKMLSQSTNLKKGHLANRLYFSDLHEANDLLKPRTLFKIGKISMQPYNVTNNFNDVKVRRIYSNNLNFVFVSYK
jgi:hypothetical protein